MKRKSILMAALSVMLAGSVNAQVFMSENNRVSSSIETQTDANPINLTTESDGSFAPLGSGALLLTALSGAYLLGKRKKKEPLN